MRILFASTRDLFRLTLGWTLEKMGHQIYFINVIEKHVLRRAILSFHPDLFMSVGWDLSPRKTAIVAEILRDYPMFQIYFAEEDDLHFDRCSLPFCLKTKPHLVLTRSPSCIEKYVALGIPAIYFDVGCNPDFHRPLPSIKKKYCCDVSVVANPQLQFHIFRNKSIHDLVKPLFDQPFHTQIWGKNWDEAVKKHLGIPSRSTFIKGVLPYHRTVHVYNASKINISIQSVEHQVSNRTYDILASGGFLLTSNTPAIRERLQPGIHCEVVNSPEETIEKIKYYLHHEDERKRIAWAGHQIARDSFSYESNLKRIWPMIEKEVKTYYQLPD